METNASPRYALVSLAKPGAPMWAEQDIHHVHWVCDSLCICTNGCMSVLCVHVVFARLDLFDQNCEFSLKPNDALHNNLSLVGELRTVTFPSSIPCFSIRESHKLFHFLLSHKTDSSTSSFVWCAAAKNTDLTTASNHRLVICNYTLPFFMPLFSISSWSLSPSII